MALLKSIGIFKLINTYHIERTRILRVQLDMQVLTLTLELSKAEEMIWNHLVMCSCISYEEAFHGRALRQGQKNRSMIKSVKRRC
ncbi:hypothetical protein Golob_018180 [Gossypium lobatum]|uniref:Uncharacterized protein n=1 Tax=Gossypium lobatum TaxID=34289 RepID=A0A7J8M9N4_9ROSI|nr:hypothetical protein [Gossypium lobatum]